jgi:hypothetical protein
MHGCRGCRGVVEALGFAAASTSEMMPSVAVTGSQGLVNSTCLTWLCAGLQQCHTWPDCILCAPLYICLCAAHLPSSLCCAVFVLPVCPPAGITYSDDKLLQTRIFSYADTQRHRCACRVLWIGYKGEVGQGGGASGSFRGIWWVYRGGGPNADRWARGAVGCVQVLFQGVDMDSAGGAGWPPRVLLVFEQQQSPGTARGGGCLMRFGTASNTACPVFMSCSLY